MYAGNYVVNTLLHNSFPNTYLSRYSSDSLDYQWEPHNLVNYQRH